VNDIDVWTFLNFIPDEFVCKCDGLCPHADVIDHALVAGLQELRFKVGMPLVVNCGTRCPLHNADVGGELASRHLEVDGTSYAADIDIPDGMTTAYLAELAGAIPQFAEGGIGLYDSFIHLDNRGFRARWDRRS